MKARRHRAATVAELALWSLLWLASRAHVLAVDAPYLHRVDELYAGAAAEELLAGRGLPLALIAHAPYSGGSILVTLAATLLFPLLGSSVLVLRLPSLLVSLAALLVWWAAVDRLFGRRAARLTALLLALAPPEFAKLTVLAWGNHAESTLFSALALLAVAALWGRDGGLRPEPGDCRPAVLVVLALAAGLAGTFPLLLSYGAAAPLLGILAALALLGPRALDRGRGAALIAGLALGALPAFLLAVARSVQGTGFLLTLLGRQPGWALRKAVNFLLFDSRRYLAPHADLPRIVEYLPWAAWALSSLALAVSLLRRLRPGKQVPAEALLLLPAATFVVFYALSDFPIAPEQAGVLAYRYVAVVTPFLLAAIGVGLARLPPAAAWTGVALLIAPLLIGGGRRLPEASAVVTRLSGSSYLAYGAHVHEVLDERLAPTLAWIERMPDPGRQRVALLPIAILHAARPLFLTDRAPVPRILGALAAADEAGTHRDLFADQLGFLLSGPLGPTLGREEVRRLGAELAPREAALALPLARAALVGLGRSGLPPEELVAEARALPGALRLPALDGVGMAAAERGPADPPPPLRDGTERAAWCHGLGLRWAYAALAACRPGQPLVTRPPGAELAPEAFQGGAEEGLARFAPEDLVRRATLWRVCGLEASLRARSAARP